MRTGFIIASSIFTIAATVPYIVEILRGNTKPRVVSWFTWTTLQAIGAAAAFADHQLPAAIYTLFCALECGAVVVLGFRHGDKKLEKLDVICLIGAAIGLLTLVFLRSPSLAVLVSVVTDFLGAAPTLKHAWFQPREETWATYALFGIGSGITLLIADFNIFTAIAYPLYLLVFDSLVTVIILTSPHRRLAPPERADINNATTPIVIIRPTGITDEKQGTKFIDTLVAANADLWSMMPKQPWLQGLTSGTLTDASIIRWAQQTRHLCILEVEALKVLRTHKPPAEVDSILAKLIEDTVSGADQLLALLKSMGATSSDEILPPCLNYGYYLLACADESLTTGLVAMCASERAYFDTCMVIAQTMPPKSRLHDWIMAWSSQELRTSLTEFERSIGKIAGTPFEPLLPDLEKVVRQIAHCELAFWEMCWKQVSGSGLKLALLSTDTASLNNRTSSAASGRPS